MRCFTELNQSGLSNKENSKSRHDWNLSIAQREYTDYVASWALLTAEGNLIKQSTLGLLLNVRKRAFNNGYGSA